MRCLRTNWTREGFVTLPSFFCLSKGSSSSIGTAMVTPGLSTFSVVFLQGGVGVTEVGSAWVKPLVKIVRMDVERREKILGWVTRRGESEYGVGVGVTLAVGSAWVNS